MDKSAPIYVAGHRGLVGSAILRMLEARGFTHIVTRTHSELDLLDRTAVGALFDDERPAYVFLAAARVGGIVANSSAPVEFLTENIEIQNNVLLEAHRTGVAKLLFLGSSCIYPKHCPQPIKEEYLLTGPLEPTNEAYAIAKIAGICLCQSLRKQYGANFISAMPTNLYGPRDNFDLRTSHVLPALVRRIHVAKERGLPSVTLWGSGTPRREFLHSDDLAAACLFLMDRYDDPAPINVGVGADLSIAELAEKIRGLVGYAGEILFDPSMPDGTPRKLLDVSRITALGWTPQITLDAGIARLYTEADRSGWLEGSEGK
jgi:GDP-L-fucose synthase